jgi:hypothetical protein
MTDLGGVAVRVGGGGNEEDTMGGGGNGVQDVVFETGTAVLLKPTLAVPTPLTKGRGSINDGGGGREDGPTPQEPDIDIGVAAWWCGGGALETWGGGGNRVFFIGLPPSSP